MGAEEKERQVPPRSREGREVCFCKSWSWSASRLRGGFCLSADSREREAGVLQAIAEDGVLRLVQIGIFLDQSERLLARLLQDDLIARQLGDGEVGHSALASAE